MEDEFERLKPAGKPTGRPAEMERWNVEDLQDYKMRLKAEIDRIDAILAGKQSVRSAADALFKADD